MSALAEKLKGAGIHPRDVAADLAIAKYLNSGGTIDGLQARLDVAAARMRGVTLASGASTTPVGAPVEPSRGVSPVAAPAPYRPRIVAPERLERRRQLQQIVQSKFKNSAGIAWSDVGWHELALLTRDGKEASALLEASPGAVPNDGRTVGEVLGIKRVDEIIEGSRLSR